ncbi:MAG: HD domain-containing protein [Candidatus Hydrogenedentes bacterium]|nr:HD domain-containing protein [Candidatus Hydrogenedentota bacterium]
MMKPEAELRIDDAAVRADPALVAVEELARAIDPEPEHAFQVCALSLALFDATQPVHGVGAAGRRRLAAAALLHDTGWTNNPGAHHKGSRDVILGARLDGFSAVERRMIACVARYHRKAHPAPGHKVYGDLRGDEQAEVCRLASILRIADGLDRSHCGGTRVARVARRGGVFRLYVEQARPSPADLFGGMRKRGLFEETFGVRVDIVAEGGPGEVSPAPQNAR